MHKAPAIPAAHLEDAQREKKVLVLLVPFENDKWYQYLDNTCNKWIFFGEMSFISFLQTLVQISNLH